MFFIVSLGIYQLMVDVPYMSILYVHINSRVPKLYRSNPHRFGPEKHFLNPPDLKSLWPLDLNLLPVNGDCATSTFWAKKSNLTKAWWLWGSSAKIGICWAHILSSKHIINNLITIGIHILLSVHRWAYLLAIFFWSRVSEPGRV